MSSILNALSSDSYIDISQYRDQHFKGKCSEQEKLLKSTHTLYVGNLSFYTTEEQVHELFSKSGDVKRIIIGLDKVKKTACGFCFVEYYTRAGAENAMRFINGTRLDDRIIRTDWDAGFKEGRQYGRGKSGGQVRRILLLLPKIRHQNYINTCLTEVFTELGDVAFIKL
uniref:Nuclear cap-binding protein subunit 2 n=1 Tax=Takifugu rubripes TaxID=31033 RepID=H2VCN1_TAKRU